MVRDVFDSRKRQSITSGEDISTRQIIHTGADEWLVLTATYNFGKHEASEESEQEK